MESVRYALREPMVQSKPPGKPRTTGIRPWLCPGESYPRLTWAVSVERLLHRVAGNPEHSPREIAARGVHKVVTEKSISQGESPRLRTGLSVVRGKFMTDRRRVEA